MHLLELVDFLYFKSIPKEIGQEEGGVGRLILLNNRKGQRKVNYSVEKLGIFGTPKG